MRRTLFSLLLKEQGLTTWEAFAVCYEAAGREVAREKGDRRLTTASLGRTTFDRWSSGTWFGRPRGEAAEVLERMFGHQVDALFSPAPGAAETPSAVASVAMRVGSRWPTSRVLLPAGGPAGTWEISGRNVLDGTTAAIYLLPVIKQGEEVHGEALGEDGRRDMEGFLRPARRGFILGAEERRGDLDVYVREATSARRSGRPSRNSIASPSIPSAYLLDDLTYAIVWALTQLDDGLLADDQLLDGERHLISTYLSMRRSAPSKLLVALTASGSSWLGSAFCARHVEQELAEAKESPVFWTREQSGEEAAPWLFFKHKIEYLKALMRFHSSSSQTVRVFCLPEEGFAQMARYERVLLVLAIALMERLGIRVRVIPHPEYSEVDGVALVPGHHAVVANWVRVPGGALWAAGSTTARGELRTYASAFADAEGNDVLSGAPNSAGRLQVLSEYLGVDWDWLTARCRSLGEYGVAGLVRPRSRLLTVSALDETLMHLGDLAPAP
ncbi:hypothetical protein YW3DRAFT_05751 [Streptomyces sp. MnatMP-M77]|uniref:hypothetical protein n=1 Tax=unclassified Streptomyces TaxID=2593676 RepID=UPI0008058796|nr:hypothetical protein [Streptomyces sp. MnatMP-M77]MYT82367.1 hypothetical protein [Streptomyces sp. SID8364]SBU96358.1 hypothetical protein YW3DRAFT_05751 [Streptomyces sp. MnatMP-M77]